VLQPWDTLLRAEAWLPLCHDARRQREERREPMSKHVDCPCGEVVRGEDDDELVSNVEAHVRDEHPDMVGTMTREQILGMASDG
jgi:hypothetical protein